MTRLFTAALALVLLAGCSSDPNYRSPMVTVVQQLRTQLTLMREAQQLPPPEAVLAATEAPVILVTSESTGLAGYLVEIETNGPVHTFGTSDRRSMSFNGGLLVATRGLGDDLMSTDVTAALAALRGATGAVTAGPEFTARREVLLLGGAGGSERFVFDCTYARVEDGVVTERCAGPEARFTNSFSVGPDGHLLRSRQWISPNLGSVDIQHLRH
ncbi:YjbF family lipoprotein [Poseidonocella sedimentorum]|uniref:Group 4 capsule polysaccharide lipoprotein gfcB, YjbF n=1 Tax=Poseidonocella sedimentorum TaxID=871652 RepID=A0A1I6D9L5_9RHOB|nr:YjbF family lipoprotein [Poseidonocella sedimentorum]SFR02022.1 Group 4 capsule polysaccharide lipoprotein gfcB, YjbF [Poseidonocella sedimentorum]